MALPRAITLLHRTQEKVMNIDKTNADIASRLDRFAVGSLLRISDPVDRVVAWLGKRWWLYVALQVPLIIMALALLIIAEAY